MLIHQIYSDFFYIILKPPFVQNKKIPSLKMNGIFKKIMLQFS